MPLTLVSCTCTINGAISFNLTQMVNQPVSEVKIYKRPALSMVTKVIKSGENRMYLPNVPFNSTLLAWLPSVLHHCGNKKQTKKMNKLNNIYRQTKHFKAPTVIDIIMIRKKKYILDYDQTSNFCSGINYNQQFVNTVYYTSLGIMF